MIVKNKVQTVVKIIFNLRFALLGAPGSFPGITFFSLEIPNGKKTKKTIHQTMIKITMESKLNKSYSCSSSIKVP